MSSTNTIFNLVKVYFKINSSETYNKNNIKASLGYLIPITLLFILFLGVIEYSLIEIARYFVNVQLGFEFLTILLLIIQAVQFVFGLSNVTNKLFGSNNNILVRIPATGVEIFISKMIYIYIHDLAFSSLIMLPYLFAFGGVFKMDALFFVMIIPTCLLIPLLPFTFSILFSIPAIFIRKLLKNKFFVILLGSIVAICVGYSIYMVSLEYVLKIVFFNSVSLDFTPEIINGITKISRFLISQRLLCNLLYLENIWPSFIILITSSFLVFVLVTFIAKKYYLPIYVNEVENYYSKTITKSHTIAGGPFIQLSYKELLNIFRSSNYSIQYFALAASMPLMVYFCTKLSLEIGQGNIGNNITVGLTCLVIIMFTSLSSSFAASTFTREGNKMYGLKLIPYSIQLQINAKLFVYSIISLLSIIISCAVVMGCGFINVQYGFAIMATTCFVAVGHIANSIKRDFKHPANKDLGNGEMSITNNNTILSISIGIIISLIFGGVIIAIHYYTSANISIYVMLAMGFVYLVLSIIRLYVGLNKCLDRIEP